MKAGDHSSIAIVGMACRYPDAKTPGELWENVLAQRQAFRRMPSERLNLDDYFSSDMSAPDKTYAKSAALIEGYEFDRVGFRVAGSAFRSADLAHWLALDIASQALEDAGFGGAEGLPREMTGVVVGNTLTGEFSRANGMRLRWPYVRRTVEAKLAEEGRSWAERKAFLDALEAQYKAPFPEIGEETLAGGLSNTIAGRICNHFDLKGGGYTVDGACSSSLLATITACRSLATGELDVALAGGVDLSLDPFEIVGFAKTGALAPEKMRVYDAKSAGFWPGEGCGFVTLMRLEDAVEAGKKIYAVIRGWGVSSDGSGGITRPEVDGQVLAVQRAYNRAGFGIDTVAYFEGHGTGTNVGDATELQALSYARREASASVPAAIGTVKANIGHTKAAAGVAGLIKAAMSLQARILPPTTGCEAPHPVLTDKNPALRVLREGEAWPDGQEARAAVSAMGFGGINTHIVMELEEESARRRKSPGTRERKLFASYQDAELFLFGAADTTSLKAQIEKVRGIAAGLSRSELSDLAAELARTLGSGKARAAVVASTPEELAANLALVIASIEKGETGTINTRAGAYFGQGRIEPRIAFLFPGQGSPAHLDGGLWRTRFDYVQDFYGRVKLPTGGDGVATEVAQPAIVTASMAALQVLERLDIQASAGVGHSLGEITALYWAGAMSEEALLRIASARGKAMAELGSATGAMASISAEWRDIKSLINGEAVVVAGLNSPVQTVISGEARDVSIVVARVQSKGMHATRLPVSHAFHSPLVEAAVPALAEQLAREQFMSPQRSVASTVTGTWLGGSDDLPELLTRQVTEPVRFLEAMGAALPEVDLLIEVGPGRVLAGLAGQFTDLPSVSLDAGGPSLKGLLNAAGAAYAMGANINHDALFAGRFTRPFDINRTPKFFVNPCELAPVVGKGDESAEVISEAARVVAVVPQAERTVKQAVIAVPVTAPAVPAEAEGGSPLELVRRLVGERAELPAEAVRDESRMLSDLHLNSIVVGKLIADAARVLDLQAFIAPTEFADASVAEIAQALEDLAKTGNSRDADGGLPPAGVDTWIRTFAVELVDKPLPKATQRRFAQRPDVPTAGEWVVFSAPEADPIFVDGLRKGLDRRAGAGGVVVCLPPIVDEHHLSLLLEAAHTVLGQRDKDGVGFVMVQHGEGAAGLARTLYLEAPKITTLVVNVPEKHERAIEWVLAEIEAASGFVEAHYDADGKRSEPVLKVVEIEDRPSPDKLGPDDVLLVTGGGKGIAAESALALAEQTGLKLALMGRSLPADDAELAANLDRVATRGVAYKYAAADVTDAVAVRDAVRELEAELGSVTAILHGAGTNRPQLLSALDEAAMLRTIEPKVQGARNVLGSIDPEKLKLFVAFGSIIARTGMKGEADYALANEWLANLAGRWQAEHPRCKCNVVEWSVWSGVGMGERLGRVEALMQEGITPIPPDQGIKALRKLVSGSTGHVPVVVAGRFGNTPTLKMEKTELPLLRFLEEPRVFYPGVELVIDASISIGNDPYLMDHLYQGNALFPAVMGLEAMSQVAVALTGRRGQITFENAEFNRPVVANEDGPLRIRLAALVQGDGRVEIALRSEETAFQIDHFRAVCVVGETSEAKGCASCFGTHEDKLPVEPNEDLYGSILFHSGRFRRIDGYRELRARECTVEIGTDDAEWFDRYLPGTFLLGDPGMHDAAIHSIQGCIPHATLLPTGLKRLVQYEPAVKGPWLTHATEVSQSGNDFVYDVEIAREDGTIIERWEGLALRRVEDSKLPAEWAAPLLSPYIERRVEELIPGPRLGVVLHYEPGSKRGKGREKVLRELLGADVEVGKRGDGKPEVIGDRSVSLSHAGDLTLVVAGEKGRGPVGCDIEPVTSRTLDAWKDLLGSERFALAEVIAGGKDFDAAATRVWSAGECLKKVGAMPGAPLTLASTTKDNWVLLASGKDVVATLIAAVKGTNEPLSVAILSRSGDASL